MAANQPGPDSGTVPEAKPDMTSWSLSSRAVHADDGIAAHRAVAPAMHVSTTFRYNEDPDTLKTWYDVEVCT
jgi:cystathionine gamma-synthase